MRTFTAQFIYFSRKKHFVAASGNYLAGAILKRIQDHRNCFQVKLSLWTSDHSFWLHMQRSGSDSRIWQIFFQSGSGMGSTQPLEELGKTSSSGFRKARLMAMGNHCTDHAAPTIHKGWYLLTSGGRSVGVVHLRTKATEFKYCHLLLFCHIIISIIILLLLSCYYIIESVYYYSYYYIILYYNLDLTHIMYNDLCMK
jgi:hypothetical protein